jgi:hypothetical protein
MAGESKHPDRLTAIASGLVALFALGVSTYNVVLQRQQIRAQVWPHLSVSSSQHEHAISIDVENEGVGPALVKTVEIFVDKQAVPDWATAFDKLGLDAIKRRDFSTIHKVVIPAGGRVGMVGIDNDELGRKFIGTFGKRLQIDICFCSVLDECWDFDGPKKRCPKAAVPFQQ